MKEDLHHHAAQDLPDSALLRVARTDPEAFGILYDRHVRSILRFFYRRTACPETAADLTAETFAEAFVSCKRYRSTGDSARAWLLGIARHQLSRCLRRRGIEDRARRRLGLQTVALDELSYERIEELVDFEPIKTELRDVIERLSPKAAQAVHLRVGLELPYAEVARRLGCSEGAARVRVTRAISRLADSMEVT